MKNTKKFVIGIFFLFLSFFFFIGCSDVLDNSGSLIADSDLTTDEQHIHTYSAYWTKDGEYHWHEATCFHNVISDKEAHQWDEGIVTQEPTESTDGIKTYTCNICGATKTETIEKPHTHEYSSLWSYNDSQHWHAAVCGHNVQKDVATHTWDNGTITRQPTIDDYGVKVFTCSICGASKSERVDKLPHTHTFESTWSSDADYHWHASNCGHNVQSEKSGHILNESEICTICGWAPYEIEERTDGSYAITKYIGKQSELIIPSELGGIHISEISDSAFSKNTALTSIIVSEGITQIGTYAFEMCTSLQNVELPETLCEIGDYAFQYCASLPNLVFPEISTCIRIGAYAFQFCLSLSNISFRAKTIEEYAFRNCTSLTTVTMIDVESIGKYAFTGCWYLEDVSFGDSLKVINDSAFAGCSLLRHVEIPYDVTLKDKVFFECDSLESVEIGNGVIPSDYLFYKCTSLTTVTISSEAKVIGNCAFQYCSSLKNLELPEKLDTIGNFAFQYCTSLQNLVFPETLLCVGTSAFYGCKSITAFDFSTLTQQYLYDDRVAGGKVPKTFKIDEYAFSYCSNLETVTLSSTVKTTIMKSAFDYCSDSFAIIFKGKKENFNDRIDTDNGPITNKSHGLTVHCTNGDIIVK